MARRIVATAVSFPRPVFAVALNILVAVGAVVPAGSV